MLCPLCVCTYRATYARCCLHTHRVLTHPCTSCTRSMYLYIGSHHNARIRSLHTLSSQDGNRVRFTLLASQTCLHPNFQLSIGDCGNFEQAEARQAAVRVIGEVEGRLGGRVPLLDPQEDMALDDAAFRKAQR